MEELKLEKMFEEQTTFQKNFYLIEDLSNEEKVRLSKEFILAAHRELGELLNTLPWKSHRKYDEGSVDFEEVLEEAIDVFKFLLNVCIIWNCEPEEFYNMFVMKSMKVKERLEQEKDHVKTIK